MSFCYFHGILPVTDGRRVQSIRSNGASVWHSLYDTMFQMESGNDLQGVLRIYSPASMSNLPEATLILAHGKFAFPYVPSPGCGTDQPADQEFFIEPINFTPFTMDPRLDDSDAFLPSDKVPTLHLLGTVVGSLVHFGDGAKGIDVRVSSFVQNRTVDCIYRYVVTKF